MEVKIRNIFIREISLIDDIVFKEMTMDYEAVKKEPFRYFNEFVEWARAITIKKD